MTLRHSKRTLKFLILVLGIVSQTVVSQTVVSQTVVSQSGMTQELQELDLADITRLKELVEAKQFNEAYAFSNSLIADWGGDPGFDLLAGQAAYGADHFQEAVFSFERVMIVNPDILLARLYLAFSYFQVKNLGAAQTELTRLLDEDLKPEDRAQVQEYLDQITKLKEAAVVSHVVNFKLSYGYDSNANSGTTLDNLSSIPVDSPFFPIIGSLDESSLEQSDNSSDIGLNYVYNQKLNQKRSIAFNGAYIQTNYDEQSQLDREILSLTGVYSDEWFGTNINITGYAQPMILDGEFFRAAYGASFDSTLTISKNWQWLWGLSYTSVNLNTNDDQDLDQFSYRTRFTYIGEAIHMFELGYGDDQSKLDNQIAISNSKDFWILSYTYLLPVGADWLLIANTSYQDIQHDGANPAIGVTREEENLSAFLSIDYLINPEWKVSGAFSYTDKDSSVEIYAYDRSTAIFSITRTF